MMTISYQTHLLKEERRWWRGDGVASEWVSEIDGCSEGWAPEGHVICVLANSGVARGITWTQQLWEYEQACEEMFSLILFVFGMHVLLFSFDFDHHSFFLSFFLLWFAFCWFGGTYKMVMVMTHPRPKDLLLKNY
jgi:hypothetical protein